MVKQAPENIGVGLSYEEIQTALARRVFELQSKWKNRDAKEYRDEYDLEKRVKMAWLTRQEIRRRLTQKETPSPKDKIELASPAFAYSMFLSRHIDYEKADDIKSVVFSQCRKLNINVMGCGGGLEPPISGYVLSDVKEGIRSCETLLAVLTPRTDEDSNIWLVSEVAMALALDIPVYIASHKSAQLEQWERLGGGYREIKWDENDFESKISQAVCELDTWLMNKIAHGH